MTEPKSRPEFWWRWRQKRWFRWTVDILFFVGLFSAIMLFQTWHHLDGGEQAPAFELVTLDGDRLNTEQLRGKPTIVFFWAPWCGVCEADAHNISALDQAVGDEANIVSVALSYESLDSVREFVDDHGVTGPVLLGERATARDYRIDSFPTIYILDREGRVASSIVGYTTELGLRARLALQGVI